MPDDAPVTTTAPSLLAGGSIVKSLASNSMTVRRMATVDAQTYWMSAKIPNDQFLLYGFAGVPSELEQALDVVRERARHCPELTLRIEDAQRSDLPGVGARRQSMRASSWCTISPTTAGRDVWPRSARWPTTNWTPT